MLREKLDRLKSEAVAAITATVSLTGELELDTRLVFTENVCFDDYDGTEQRCITDLEYIEEGARIRVSVTNIDGDQIDDFDLEKLSLPVEELVELHESCVRSTEAPAT